jgi:hypothetical protein
MIGRKNIHYLGYYLSVLSPEFSIPPLSRRWNSSGPVKMTCNLLSFYLINCIVQCDRLNYYNEVENRF